MSRKYRGGSISINSVSSCIIISSAIFFLVGKKNKIYTHRLRIITIIITYITFVASCLSGRELILETGVE